MRLAIIADSHFHPPGVPSQAVWHSDRWFNARNDAALDLVERARADLVIHLGDVVHPVPGLAEHGPALDVAQAAYARFGERLRVVPGNHDVGDKPHPWAPAPSVSVEKHQTYRARWGAPWWVEDIGPLRLVGIDTPVLNSGLMLEAEQWEWLACVLQPVVGRRTLVFMHYPPFLLEPGEPEHYDNLAEPARSRLLDLLEAAQVEAAFCGHVHHPFWNRHRGTDWYLLPSTAFVRPGFAELSRVGPGAEFGRDEGQRLGFCVVDVEPEGLHVEWVPTEGNTVARAWAPGLGPGERRPDCPLGLTLRHAWDGVYDVPADGLDPFRRKRARNDLAVLAAWSLGARRLRLPLQDLRDDGTRQRLLDLAHLGFRVVFWTVEGLQQGDQGLVALHREWIDAVEFVVPRALLDRALPELLVPRLVAAFGRVAGSTAAYFSHFAPHGFAIDDVDLSRAQGDGVLLRMEPEDDPFAFLARAAEIAGAQVLCLLPRAGESDCYTDDSAIAARVQAIFLAARLHPQVPVWLDTFEDHDRGYFTRHGLIDRRGNPRPAWQVLRNLARLVPVGALVERTEEGWRAAGMLGIDLATGLRCQDSTIDNSGPVYWTLSTPDLAS
jgi:3',5'-cyclic AMP phosphodiesterase CpdA